MSVLPAAVRDAVIAGDDPRCHYCNRKSESATKDPDGRTWNVDHKVPTAKGGTDDSSNLVRACARCNNEKHTRDYDDFVAFALTHYWQPDAELTPQNLMKLLEAWKVISRFGGSESGDVVYRDTFPETVNDEGSHHTAWNVEVGRIGSGWFEGGRAYHPVLRLDDVTPWDGSAQLLKFAAFAHTLLPALLDRAGLSLDELLDALPGGVR